jgi:hypothetical protein
MAGQGPSLKPGEAENVIEFIIKRAKQLQKREFSIEMDELKPLLVGAMDEGHYINRIRWKMKDQFRKAKIKSRCRGNSYEFELSPNIDIDIAAEKKNRRANIDVKKTSTNFDEPFIAPPWFPDLLDSLDLGDKPILIGPAGCGKSRTLEEAFARLGREIYRIALGEYRDPADLIGTKEIVNENGVPTTKLVGGLLTEAMEKGCGVILDEYDMCSPGMVSALNKVMESGIEMLLPTENGSFKFRPHKDTLIAATANTWGYGDDEGMFAGAQMQNRASWDRLRPKMDCDYDYAIENRLVSRYLPPKVIDALYSDNPAPNKLGIVRIIRKAISDPANPLEDVFGLRSILWFAQKWETFGWHKGLYYILNDFRQENRESISLIIKNRLGAKFVPSRNDFDKNAPNYIPDMITEVVAAGFGN